jgi:hypothetical protein
MLECQWSGEILPFDVLFDVLETADCTVYQLWDLLFLANLSSGFAGRFG